jgi:diaminopimelate epimerase
MIPFTKGHGLGNDYLVMRDADLSAPLSTSAIVRICDRNWGVGSDGLLLHVASTRADFGLRIFNPDGSEAEKSGNGLRIFAKYLWDHGHATDPTFTVETKGGVVACHCHLSAGGRMNSVTVEMGEATFAASAIPMLGPEADAVGVELGLPDGTRRTVTAVSVGNPHCVVFVDRPDADECRRLGPLIERHPAFPNRTNVQFVGVRSRGAIEIQIWERGAGYTLASGSSSCAAAAAAVRTRRCDPGRVTVTMPGGELAIDVRPDFTLTLEGPVETVCSGTLSAEFERTYVSGATR